MFNSHRGFQIKKCTIEHGENFHLYEECFDNKNIYLEITGGEVNFEVTLRYAVFVIPREIWEKIKNKNIGYRFKYEN